MARRPPSFKSDKFRLVWEKTGLDLWPIGPWQKKKKCIYPYIFLNMDITKVDHGRSWDMLLLLNVILTILTGGSSYTCGILECREQTYKCFNN